MSTPNRVILHDPGHCRWLKFEHPVEIIQTYDCQDVLAKLHEVETAVEERNLHAAGFLAYEAAPGFDDALTVNEPKPDSPLLWFGLYGNFEVIDLPFAEIEIKLTDWKPTVNRDEYDQAIEKIKTHIAEGDTYQVNYTFRLQTDFSDAPWQLFLKLTAAQNGGYSAFIETDDQAICSVSPELFFQLDSTKLTCKPMKGTAPRGKYLDDDVEQMKWLHHSEKNRAENVMIVDMARNDMGKVSEVGSVNVPSLFAIERYPTVLQMTSTVTSQTSASLLDIFTALFPCASITGAPKVSTMQIIQDLETTPRGVYTGCIGYISPNRQAQFNVAIRTVTVDKINGTAEYGVGGGIVWDSDAAEEFEECRIKAEVLMRKKPTFSLLESMLWEPDGFFLPALHLRRLEASAEYFDIPFNQKQLYDKLNQITEAKADEPLKIRVLLSQDGTITVEAVPLQDIPVPDPVRVKLAQNPVDSNDVFLYHKTTQRSVYDTAKVSQPDCDDVILWNEHGHITESTRANIVCNIDGELVTPPVSDGLLAGTYRTQLLNEGEIQERSITVGELKNCNEIFLINSIRRWMQVQLV